MILDWLRRIFITRRPVPVRVRAYYGPRKR